MLGCNRWARVQKTQFMNGYEGHYVSIEEYNFTLLLKAAIIAGKKEGALTNFRDVRDQYHKMSMELEQKREVAKEAGGGEVLKGEDVSYRPTLTDPNTHRHTHTLKSRWTTLAGTHTHPTLEEGRQKGGDASQTYTPNSFKDENVTGFKDMAVVCVSGDVQIIAILFCYI